MLDPPIVPLAVDSRMFDVVNVGIIVVAAVLTLLLKKNGKFSVNTV